MFLLIWIVYLGSVNSLSESPSRLCFLYGESKHVFCQNKSSNLACFDNQLIRIKDIEIEMKISGPINDCSRCPPDTAPGVWKNVTDIVYIYLKALLYKACSRKNRCNFITGDIGNDRIIWTANVIYECVEHDLFKDICSPWIQETNSVHIFLESTGNAISNCSCTIKGDTETTSIEVVDYRPYGNDFRCVGSSFIVDDKEMFHCEESGTNVGMGSSVFNEIRTVNSNVTEVEVLLPGDVPEMIWIHMKGLNMTVQCNTDDSSSTFPSSFLPSPPSTSLSTVVTISTDTLPEINTTKETTDTESDTVTTSPLQPNKGNEDKTIFSLPVIAGGSAGLLFLVVIIAVIICFLCRRKPTQTSKHKDKENMYAQYNTQSNTANISPIKSGVINQGNETENKMVHIVLKDFSNSNYEEVGRKYEEADNGDYECTEYAEPADVVADNIYADTSKTEAGIQMSQKTQNNIKNNNYTEPYDNGLTIETESQNNTDKVINSVTKKQTYDTCSEIDNYSHILIGMTKQAPKTKDNYSHIQIAGNKHEITCLGNYSHTKVIPRDGSKAQECSDMYTHVQNDTPKQQGLSYKETKSEEGEYDHLNKFPHP